MTRRILAATALLAAVVAVPATALETSPCPTGDKGVIVSHGGHTLTICTNVI